MIFINMDFSRSYGIKVLYCVVHLTKEVEDGRWSNKTCLVSTKVSVGGDRSGPSFFKNSGD